jgi:hypothetical protein
MIEFICKYCGTVWYSASELNNVCPEYSKFSNGSDD